MKKSLKAIQLFMKVGKIVSKIVNVFCIVGIVGCAIGLVSLIVVPEDIKVGDITIKGLIENNAGLTIGALYITVSTSLIMCIGETVLSKMSYNYFKNELIDGTPFTMKQSKAMFTIGVKHIIVPAISMILAAICYGIMSIFFGKIDNFEIDSFGSIAFGCALMILSVFTKYTACALENKEEVNE